MDIQAGTRVWTRCEVKPGPFSDERAVRVNSGSGIWVGFVETRHLREPLESGQTWIRTTIVNVTKDRVLMRFPGHSLSSPVLYGDRGGISLDPVTA